jgi:hypothetical protein
VIGFPLLIVPLAIFNMIAFILDLDWGTKLYTFRLVSGVEWTPTLGDAFLVFSLLLLMFEFIKSTSYGKSVVEHLLSILLAGGAGAEFVMVAKAGNSVFLLFTAICVVDMFAGFAASLRRARRTQAVDPVAHAPYTPPPAPPPRAEPAPAAPVPHAEPKAEPTVVVLPRTEPGRFEPVQKIEP